MSLSLAHPAEENHKKSILSLHPTVSLFARTVFKTHSYFYVYECFSFIQFTQMNFQHDREQKQNAF